MAGRAKITTSDSKIKGKILFLAKERVNKALRNAAPIIENQCRIIIARNLSQSPVISSLLNGKLKVDFGLTNDLASSATNSIISLVSSTASVELTSGKDIKSVNSLIVKVPPINSAVASKISGGSYTSNGMFGGGQVSWLEWLLTKGTTVVVGDFQVVSTLEYDDRSRSGGGFMLPVGGAFRVDPSFSGVEGDNFITRAIAMSINEIEVVIKKEFNKAIK